MQINNLSLRLLLLDIAKSILRTLQNKASAASLCFLLTVTAGLQHNLSAQTNGQFIYGMITTEDGDEYEGFMRWGKEEMTWHDIFNSTKTDEEMGRSTKSGGSLWGDFDWSISSLWKDKYKGSNHTFACQFGDIAALYPQRRERVDIELKNGSIIKVDGGSNDVGATITMQDYELGQIKFDWDRIESVEFFQAPTDRRPKYGKLLYGTAETRRGERYTGFIKWDDDERMGDDILDGDSRNGEQKVPFENIVSIEKDGRGSQITFKSGREIYLDGSNDVGDGNRGIIVHSDGIGTIEIPWKYFDRLTLEDPPIGPTYRDYVLPDALQGSVISYDGTEYEGQIIFDMDELWDFEILDGEDDYVKYEIPFRNIKRIVPKNRSYSLVYLRNGQELLLGDTQDVSNNNDGILIARDPNRKSISIDWDDIDEIIFK